MSEPESRLDPALVEFIKALARANVERDFARAREEARAIANDKKAQNGEPTMPERDRLKERVIADMKKLDDPAAIRDSWAIAHEYERMGYNLSHDEIRAVVREAARETGVNVG